MGVLESFARGWVEARSRHAAAAHVPSPAFENDALPVDTGGASEAVLIAELENKNLLIADLRDELEAQQARAERFAAVLLLPGVRQSLQKAFHADRHPNLPDADKRLQAEGMVKINVAYDTLEGKSR